MSAINGLLKRGLKPRYEVYRVLSSELQKMAEDLLKNQFGYDFDVDISKYDENDEHNRELVFYIEYDTSDPNWRDDLFEETEEAGCDISNGLIARDYIMENLTEDLDCYLEFGGYAFGGQDDFYIDIWLPARKDISEKVENTLNTIMNGSREDAIIAVNQLFKDIRS